MFATQVLILNRLNFCKWLPSNIFKNPVSIDLYVLLSILLSGSFLGISLLFFSETLYDVKGPYGNMVERARFFLEKSPSSKNNQIWSKYGPKLGFLDYLLVLSGNGVEWKHLWPFSILQKPHIWEKLVLKEWVKMLSANQISIFFNRQYPVHGLKSDSNFLHVDRHEWTRQSLLMVFLQKLSFRANGLFWT